MITVGQLTTVAQSIPQLADDMVLAGVDLSNLPADAVVAEDVLSIVALFWPPATVLEEALVVAIALAPLIAASGIKPDPLPMVDAQTSQSRGGRNS